MSLPAVDPTTTKAWKALLAHYTDIQKLSLQQLFSEDPERSRVFCRQWKDFHIDFSKTHCTESTIALLCALAQECGLQEAIAAQFSGEAINETENRAVLHTALRQFSNAPKDVQDCLARMKSFSEAVLDGSKKGVTGKPITDIVNIGIGGSDLGPAMVTEALSHYKTHVNVHYISNIDGDYLEEKLQQLPLETTLFFVVSKSFTTQETLTNAHRIKDLLIQELSVKAVSRHFVAVSANTQATRTFGIVDENIFPMWDWVGGRFSLWSAAGLSVCCTIGYNNFERLLEGAHQMDLHFKETPFDQNIPVLLGLLSVWYTNFFHAETEAVIPYSQHLNKLVPYLQQASMESNGKRIDRNGKAINYKTGTIVWGNTGTNAQHAFFQLLHQGTRLIPVDFIAFANPLSENKTHHELMLANCFAQTEALMQGTSGKKVASPYKEFPGNKPSTTILIQKLLPETLGSLLALYEHKIFVQGIIWNIFSYDQWGVELGKSLAKHTYKALKGKDDPTCHTATKALLEAVKRLQ